MGSTLREELDARARFSAGIRSFFSGRGYIEVDTPTLSPFLIPEPSIEVFQTELISAGGAPRPLWLIPSPELWMKRLVARGSGSIFQVSRAFRNGDFGSPIHNPEFRLLEWYTVGRRCDGSIADTEALFSHLLSLGLCRGDPRRLRPPFTRLSMADAFKRHAAIDLADCTDDARMVKAARDSGLQVSDDTTGEQAFHLAFLDLVEPHLPRDRPLVLSDYPALVPTTARRRRGTPWAERWELYVDGVEIANCYTEETDPAALRELISSEERRKAAARVPHATDRALADAFGPGFPDCTGAALGVDRLEMVFAGEKTLEGVINFPFSAILPPQSDTG